MGDSIVYLSLLPHWNWNPKLSHLDLSASAWVGLIFKMSPTLRFEYCIIHWCLQNVLSIHYFLSWKTTSFTLYICIYLITLIHSMFTE